MGNGLSIIDVNIGWQRETRLEIHPKYMNADSYMQA
jgi:hypothetical protein